MTIIRGLIALCTICQNFSSSPEPPRGRQKVWQILDITTSSLQKKAKQASNARARHRRVRWYCHKACGRSGQAYCITQLLESISFKLQNIFDPSWTTQEGSKSLADVWKTTMNECAQAIQAHKHMRRRRAWNSEMGGRHHEQYLTHSACRVRCQITTTRKTKPK